MNSGNVACVANASPPWVIDSGANSHISGIASSFTHMNSIDHHIILADGTSRPVRGTGVLHPTSSMSLPSSLYVPNFPFNLLSVSQLTKSLNCSVTFFPSSCIFQDLQTQKTIGLGHEKYGLYHLDLPSSPPTSSVLSAAVSPLQWHFRLGHPSLQKLKLLVPNLSPALSLECEACQLGKHHRAFFPNSDHSRASESFDVVHTDIWGPCRTKSIHGYFYFVIFVDGFSRMTWLFLLKDRTDLPRVLSIYYNEILVQFGKRIKIIRSDNALEYT